MTKMLRFNDPPYDIGRSGGGAFGYAKRTYRKEVAPLSYGVDNDVLEELCRVMRKPNIYLWCNKNQLRQYIDFFEDKGCTTDLLTWHKTNPVPACSNKYLSDTEYLLYFRGKGVPMYGTYATKKKYYVSKCNTDDKKKYHHPTIKPLPIIVNLIVNSSQGGGTVLDPFMGSGTTGVACRNLGRDFIGIEISEEYFNIAKARIEGIGEQLEMRL